jgi:hypothetical protein
LRVEKKVSVRVRQNKVYEALDQVALHEGQGEKNCQKTKKIVADTGKMALGEGWTEQSK